jgi:hypothetical protein
MGVGQIFILMAIAPHRFAFITGPKSEIESGNTGHKIDPKS